MPPKSRKNAKSSKSEHKISQQSTPAASPFPPAPVQLPDDSETRHEVLRRDTGGKEDRMLVELDTETLEKPAPAPTMYSPSATSRWPANIRLDADQQATANLVSFDSDEPGDAGVISPAFGSPAAIPVPPPRNQTPPFPSAQEEEPAAAAAPTAHIAAQPVPSSPPVVSSLSASLRKHSQTPPFSPGAATTFAAAAASPSAPSPPRSPPIPNISVKYPSRPVSPPTPIVSKRYPAPAQLTRLDGTTAPPVAAVVDLGTARRGSVSSGVRKNEESRPTPKRTEGRLEVVTADGRDVGQSKVRSGSHRVLWSRWDNVKNHRGSSVAKLLFVGYKDPASLSIWDCTKLDSMMEILRLDAGSLVEDHGEWTICYSGILPDVPRTGGELPSDRPLVGILIGPEDDSSSAGKLLIYSLKAQKIVNKINIEGTGKVDKFMASSSYIAISTTSPPQIHVYSSTTFKRHHTIDSSQISPFIPPAAQSVLPLHSSAGAAVLSKIAAYSQLASPVVSQARSGFPERRYGHGYGRSLDAHEAARLQTHDTLNRDPVAQENASHSENHEISYYDKPYLAPVFSLSHRLLAFASPLAVASRSSTPAEYSAPSSYNIGEGKLAGLGMGSGPAGLPGTQAELGNAALRVGGSVWGGMRTLGGLALSAAKSRVSGNTGDAMRAPNGGTGAKFFSRSAPEGSSNVIGAGDWGGVERGDNKTESPLGDGSSTLPSTPVHAGSELRSQIAVIDLAKAESSSTSPIAEFSLSREKQPATIAFSPDGCSLAIAPYDGHTIKVYRLRPSPLRLTTSPSLVSSDITPPSPDNPSPLHVYNLRRGRTSATVECIEWSEDGRWLAILTRKRTGHIFAINPYGGKTDARSHADGRIRNVDEIPSTPTDLYPLLRIRAANVDQEHLLPSFSYGYINASDYLQPSSVVSPPRSMTSDTGSSPPHSPHSRRRAPNYIDGLLFDHLTSSLSLRRILLDLKPKDHNYGIGASSAFGTSISFPGIGTPSRLSGSSSFKSSSPSSGGIVSPSQHRLHGRSATTNQPTDIPMELAANEQVVMTWNLRRTWDGSQLGKCLQIPAEIGGQGHHRADWLALAELSTYSRSQTTIPRPIYLSHQFLFHTLGEDYHALIRRYQLEVAGNHIEVRKQVQVSAYPAGEGESFVEGFSSPRDHRNRTVSSSFDEPLASALGVDLDQPHSPTVLPMYPNGPATRGPPLRNSIPIRTVTGISDNVTGRIRRELQKVRSPRLKPKADDNSPSVPLEFDEEDEDFVNPHSRVAPHSNRPEPLDTSDTHAIDIQTPSSDKRVVDLWGGWSSTDHLAVTEAEKFDDIDVLGLLDEEGASRKDRR